MNASRRMVAALVTYSAITMNCISADTIKQEGEPGSLLVQVSMGDFIDKLSILEIKCEHIKDPVKLRNVNKEYDHLLLVFSQSVCASEAFDELYARLMVVNTTLWDLEDSTRIKERNKQFDASFAADVEKIIRTNDERARLKRALNELLGSQIMEEKSYEGLLTKSQNSAHAHNGEQQAKVVAIPTPLADLADRITILQIKKERIHDDAKLSNIEHELSLCLTVLYQTIPQSDLIDNLLTTLKYENERMWDLQDALRAKLAAQAVDEEFISYGRSVYKVNDARCAVKRKINATFGSQLVEEKCYASY